MLLQKLQQEKAVHQADTEARGSPAPDGIYGGVMVADLDTGSTAECI